MAKCCVLFCPRPHARKKDVEQWARAEKSPRFWKMNLLNTHEPEPAQHTWRPDNYRTAFFLHSSLVLSKIHQDEARHSCHSCECPSSHDKAVLLGRVGPGKLFKHLAVCFVCHTVLQKKNSTIALVRMNVFWCIKTSGAGSRQKATCSWWRRVGARGSREIWHLVMSYAPAHAGVFGHELTDVLADVVRCGGETPMMPCNPCWPRSSHGPSSREEDLAGGSFFSGPRVRGRARRSGRQQSRTSLNSCDSRLWTFSRCTPRRRATRRRAFLCGAPSLRRRLRRSKQRLLACKRRGHDAVRARGKASENCRYCGRSRSRRR